MKKIVKITACPSLALFFWEVRELLHFGVVAFRGCRLLGLLHFGASKFRGVKVWGRQSLGASKFRGVEVWGCRSLGRRSSGTLNFSGVEVRERWRSGVSKFGASKFGASKFGGVKVWGCQSFWGVKFRGSCRLLMHYFLSNKCPNTENWDFPTFHFLRFVFYYFKTS